MSEPSTLLPPPPSWVFDTNVIVSAHLNAHGVPARLLAQVIDGRLRLTFDARIALEYAEVLARPRFALPASSPQAFLDLLRLQDQVSPAPLPASVAELPDEDDRIFLEAAQVATDQVLVTGNLKHYPASACTGVALVLSPADAWQRFCRAAVAGE
jgi:putative PIN family toxin of toxin-antitoxin system